MFVILGFLETALAKLSGKRVNVRRQMCFSTLLATYVAQWLQDAARRRAPLFRFKLFSHFHQLSSNLQHLLMFLRNTRAINCLVVKIPLYSHELWTLLFLYKKERSFRSEISDFAVVAPDCTSAVIKNIFLAESLRSHKCLCFGLLMIFKNLPLVA